MSLEVLLQETKKEIRDIERKCPMINGYQLSPRPVIKASKVQFIFNLLILHTHVINPLVHSVFKNKQNGHFF